MAHSKARVTDGKVTYPPGVKEISDKISKEEMVRRLKVSIFSAVLLQPCVLCLMCCCTNLGGGDGDGDCQACQHSIVTLLNVIANIFTSIRIDICSTIIFYSKMSNKCLFF